MTLLRAHSLGLATDELPRDRFLILRGRVNIARTMDGGTWKQTGAGRFVRLDGMFVIACLGNELLYIWWYARLLIKHPVRLDLLIEVFHLLGREGWG